MKQTTGYLVIILNEFVFYQSKQNIHQWKMQQCLYITRHFYLHCSVQCKYTFVNSHNVIEDFQILSLIQIPVQLLLIFFLLTYYLISSMLVYLTHQWFRGVRGSPDLKIFYVGLSFVFSRWIAISVRSNLLTVLFKLFLELLDFICCVYLLLTELYKCSTLVVDFSVSPCGLLSFCFNVLMLCYKVMTA